MGEFLTATIDQPRSQYLLAPFCATVYPIIQEQLTKRQQSFLYLAHIKDPFSTDSCRRAVFSVDDGTLERFGIMRAGAKVLLNVPGEKAQKFSHAYFASHNDATSVADFTVGQMALWAGTTLDEWIGTYPSLFIGRALCTDKATAARTLGIVYPDMNEEFWEFFDKR